MKRLIRFALAPICFLVFAMAPAAEQGWWMQEPIRWVQTNIRDIDAGLDAKHLVDQLAGMKANVLLIGMGGITAFYPTAVPFHYPSTAMPAGRDMFGDVLREAHSRQIRVVGRFDFSKTPKAVFDAHPDWFFRKADGEPVIYNGLYSTCINGGYVRGQEMKILAEALERYPVDGLFFNGTGNQSRDYSGNSVGLCHCENCQRKYRQLYNRGIPDEPDADYRRFLADSTREVAAAVGDLIHAKRPAAGYFQYLQEYSDGIMSESNTAVGRPLWPYSASDNVDRARNSQPGKMAVNLDMQFVDFSWRFATVPREEIALRLWQNVAHGGAAAFEVNGTLDQQDRQAVETAGPIFRWLAANEQYYVGQSSAARVLLLGTAEGEQYRGLFRLLTEEHIPFAVSTNLDWLGKRPFDVVVAADGAPAGLREYAANGGRVFLVGARPPAFEVAPIVRTIGDVKGYVRVRDHAAFPSLRDTDLVMLDGAFTEAREPGGGADPSLTLIPPSMFGPPERVHADMKDTATPAILFRQIGKGSAVWIPWNLATMYQRSSLPAHAGLFRDVMDRLIPRRQLRTNAHPLVEMTLMNQGGHTLLHLINMSGQSQTAYFAPVPMVGIRVELEGHFKTARTLRSPGSLAVKSLNGYSEFTIPRLSDYEVIVLD